MNSKGSLVVFARLSILASSETKTQRAQLANEALCLLQKDGYSTIDVSFFILKDIYLKQEPHDFAKEGDSNRWKDQICQGGAALETALKYMRP